MSFKEVLAKPGMKPLIFTAFLLSFGFGIIIPIMPFYATSLGATPFELGLMTATFAIVSLVCAPLFGKLSDRYGKKRFMVIGMLGYAIDYVILMYSDSLLMLVFARAFGGLCSAALMPATMALISEHTTERQRGHAMGLFGMMFGAGFVLGPAFGGIMSAVSLHDTFLICAGISLANMLFIAYGVRDAGTAAGHGRQAAKDQGFLKLVSSPLVYLFLTTFMVTFMIGGMDTILALYTAEKMGFTSTQIGVVFAFIGITMMVMELASGALINRFGESKLIMAGLFVNGAGFMLFSITADWLTLFLPLCLFVIGASLATPAAASFMTKSAPGGKGAVLGIDSSFRSLGQIAGPILGGLAYGINHYYAFIGMALVSWAFLAIFWTNAPADKLHAAGGQAASGKSGA